MKDDSLRQLLTDADVPAPFMDGGSLAQRVRRRERRELRNRRIGVAAGIVLAGGLAIFAALKLGGQRSPIEPEPRSLVEAPSGELSRQIESRRLVIQVMLESERRRAVGRELAAAQVSPAVVLKLERDRAAGALMEYAAELRRKTGRENEAGREYRKVIELFPDSPLALAAREGLERLKGIER